MPLDFQTRTIPLAQGVDTKPDPKQLPAGKLTSLKNATFQSPGRLKKRPACTALATLDEAGTTDLANGVGTALATLKNELLQENSSTLYSWGVAGSRWVRRGTFPRVAVSQSSVVRNTYQQTVAESAYHAASQLTCWVWEDTSTSLPVQYMIVDRTGSVVSAPAGLGAANGVTRPRVLALGNYFVVFYSLSSTLYYQAIDTTVPALTLGAQQTVTASQAASLNYDAAVVGSQIVVACDRSTPDVALYRLSTALVLSGPTTFAGPATDSIAIFPDSNAGDSAVAWGGGNVVKMAWYDSGLSLRHAAVTVDSPVTAARMTGCVDLGLLPSAGSVWLFYEVSGPIVKVARIGGYAVSSAAIFNRGMGLASKAFCRQQAGTQANFANSFTMNVLFAWAATLQPTYFLMSCQYLGRTAYPTLSAKISYGLGGGLPARSMVPQVNQTSPDVYQVATLIKDRTVVTGGVTYGRLGIQSTILDFTEPLFHEESAGGVLLSGGFITHYDGGAQTALLNSALPEHGFHLFPEGVQTSLTDADAGTAQTYQYVVCYEYVDNAGNTQRSAPSPAVTQQKLTAIDGTHRVTVTIPTLRATSRAFSWSSSNPIELVVYRTVANGTIFYRTSGIVPGASLSINDVTLDIVAFVDSTTDATLLGNLQLYTTGGVLENIEPGPVGHMTKYADRVVAIDSEHPLSLWRSHQVVPGAPVEFSDVIKLNVDEKLVAVTALAVLDEKLIVFGAASIAIFTGQGPDRTGANDDMGSGYVLPSDVGCIDPRSIVKASSGIGFKSSKGYYLLDRSLNVQYIGAEVESFNATSIVGTFIDSKRTQARLMLSTGTELVYDDRMGQWGTFVQETSGSVVDVTLWQGVPVYLKSDGTVHQETAGTFTGVAMSFQTGWISFAGLSGFQRVRGLALLGDWISPHSLTVTVESALDSYDSPVTDTYSITATTGPDQWRIPHLKTQKCQAIRITVTESGSEGEALSLSSITLELGIKKGLAKLPAARTL